MSQWPERETPIGDDEREVVVARIRRAMSDELIAFDEIDQRFAAIYAADSRAELALVTADLPQLPPPTPVLARHPIAPSQFSVFGDIKKVGDVAVDGDVSYRAVFGDVLIDLSAVAALPDGLTVVAGAVFGDVTVIVPDGHRVAVVTRSVFGDSVDELSPPLPRSALIHVKVSTVFGDTRVYSLSRVPEGRLRRFWRTLRGRPPSDA